MASYVRTRGGAVAHRADCWRLKRAKQVYPWHWAEGKTPIQIWWEFVQAGVYVHQCETCMYASETPPWRIVSLTENAESTHEEEE